MAFLLLITLALSSEQALEGRNEGWSTQGRAAVEAAACDLLASKMQEQRAINEEATRMLDRLDRYQDAAKSWPSQREGAWRDVALEVMELATIGASREQVRAASDGEHLKTIYRSFCPSRP